MIKYWYLNFIEIHIEQNFKRLFYYVGSICRFLEGRIRIHFSRILIRNPDLHNEGKKKPFPGKLL